ncbi:squalene-hopene cyclase [Iodidimonas gelatinilytica]|uniref:Squalene-hopene cyclase n=2 Tax=Iodidimonas gelatinilytica TaxID=1236966 RepID=A0A5A7MMD2_9PROT|nr:squalene--hopene cyclase [Iodidimonas gelatinilytica]GEQ97130.1 squalene-hopene cyclase [Iodidimonas gelatinilytica]
MRGEDLQIDRGLQDQLDFTIGDALTALKKRQQADGHLIFDLEADATIPAEYIFLNHHLDEREPALEQKLARYIRSIQQEEGGWPLYHGGAPDISASVKAYLALKITGDSPDQPHMAKARAVIHRLGGAEKTNVFTRYALALFGEVPWRAVPVMPVELMLMPKWFPANMWRFSYWSRTVIAPLLILAALKPKAINPTNTHIPELFLTPPEDIRDWQQNPTGRWTGKMFLQLDKILRVVEPYFPKKTRQKAIAKAEAFFTERLNGEDGLGAIFPAMANSVMAMEALGYPKDHPALVTAKKSIKLLVTEENDETFVQPCLSPIWDTSLSAHALLEAGEAPMGESAKGACDWLASKQILDVKGDWAEKAPDLRPGGWAFQYNNDHYPDVDDTAVVAMALHRTQNPAYKEAIDRAEEWIIGMQSTNGGWGAFDIDNDDHYLNHIPFADHGALLDPPTEDVSARCLSFLGQLGHDMSHPTVKRGIDYLKNLQEDDGSWYGRWGTNYVYGTWSVLSALNAVGVDMDADYVQKAVNWLKARQNDDGGWGESGDSYYEHMKHDAAPSTPSQTAWALLGLMAAGHVKDEATRKGIDFLLAHPRTKDGRWEEPWYNAVGFPRVFYLRYHGYSHFFPVWALSRYRNLTRSNDKSVQWGM